MRNFIIILTLIFNPLIGCNQNQNDTVQPAPSLTPISQTTLDEAKLNPNWVFINRDIQWEAPPKQIEQTFKGSLNSRIAVFYPSGNSP